MYGNILLPVSRTTNLKFLVDFTNIFLKPAGSVTFLHVVTSDKFSMSPMEWRRAMSVISTTHMLSMTEGMCINYKLRNSASVVTGILDESKADDYDLILFANSTYRRHLLSIFGNKVDDVIRNSNVETAVLSYLDDKPMNYRKILLPTSGFQHTVKAASIAAELSKKYGGEITVLHVGEDREAASKALQPILNSLNASGIPHRALFRKGHIVDTILDEADKGYDLMMIGATERPQLYQFLIGSTADMLIKKSPCPVLMVKTFIKSEP